MAIDWTRTICVIDDDTVNLICGKEILYVRGIAAGRGISSINKTSTAGLVDTYTITYTDGTTSTFDVINGRGIDDIQKTSTTENVDTYTIYYSDGTTSTFDVTNGTYISGVEGTVTVQRSRITSGFIFYNLPTEADGTAEMMSIEIVPAQSGSGTPSASNIRPLLSIDRLLLYIYETGGDSGGSNLKFLPEASYGGNWDIVSGTYTKTWEYIASYAGETLPGRWISDRDAYAAGTTPTIGAEVAYELATPVEISGAGSMTVPFFDGGTEVAMMLSSTTNEASLGGLTASKVPGKVKIKDYIDGLIPEDAPNNNFYYWKHQGAWKNVKGGKIIYVNGDTGSDDNDGTSSTTAFKTISKALKVVPPVTAACQIVIASGTYSDSVSIQDASIILTANGGTVTLTGTWRIVRATIQMTGTAFVFNRNVKIYHNAYVQDNGVGSLTFHTTNAYENSLEIFGSTFLANNSLTLGVTGSNYACVWTSGGSRVWLGTATLSGQNGVRAYGGSIVAAVSLTGSTTPKTTGEGGRILLGAQVEFYSKDETDDLLALKAPIASPELTGTPKSTTPPEGDNSTRIATTAFIQAALAALIQATYYVSVSVDGEDFKLSWFGPFEIVETGGVFYLNWLGTGACPFSIEQTGTDYVLYYNE